MASIRVPHAPLGAKASFDFGPPGEPAGFALPADKVPAQDVFVGCRPGAFEPWNLLPFFAPKPGGPQPLPKGRFGRFLALAGDKWMIGPLVFKLCTPVFLEAAECDRIRYAPVVCGYLEYDNSHGPDTAELIFGVGGGAESLTEVSLAGFHFAGTQGFATAGSPEVSSRQDAGVLGPETGPVSVLHFAVPPQSKRIFPLVFAFYQSGFHYTHHFADLAAVLACGLAEHRRYLAAADAHDIGFMRSAAPPETRNRVALATREWLSCSRRLRGEPEIDLRPLRELLQTLGASLPVRPL